MPTLKTLGGNMNNQVSEITVNTFNVLCRMNDVMRDIICLKKENRSFSQRIKHLHQKRSEYLKIIKINKDYKDILRDYNEKLDSNINREIYLTKLQKYNSKLILNYRNEIQQLRKELV